MRFARLLSIKNIRRKPTRAAALIVLSALLSLSVFGGTIIISSLQNGLKSMETRLGADVVVIPAEAQRKNALETILIQGVPGYFYMDDSVLADIRNMESVKEAWITLTFIVLDGNVPDDELKRRLDESHELAAQ